MTIKTKDVQTISKSTFLMLMILIIISSCKKTEIQRPQPTDPTPTPTPLQKGSFFFSTAVQLNGEPYNTTNLHAVVSIAKASGELVLDEQVINIELQPAIKTVALELPYGQYKLTAFRLVYSNGNTHFAAPITGSLKAAAVSTPLSINFSISESTVKQVGVEVLKVKAGDLPQNYGYASGTFDNEQAETNPYMKIKMKALMRVGEVLYDSIPASLIITTYGTGGQQTTTYTALAAGINELQLQKSASKFSFRISKWGMTDEVTLQKEDIDPNTVYALGGSGQAKRLSSERTYKIVNGQDVSESKTDYFYNNSGGLAKIDYWLRKPDNSPYLAMTDRFEYSNNLVSKIIRTDIQNNVTLKETSFTYNQQGKVIGIREMEGNFETIASVSYHPSTQEVIVNYNYPGRTFDMNYYMVFRNGNVVSSAAAKSNHDNVLGRYDYDLQINPYRHMNWPNLFLSNSSKNNISSQVHEYSDSYPTAEPFSFTYKYDADGYPVEVVKNFRTFPGGNYSFSTKTVYVY